MAVTEDRIGNNDLLRKEYKNNKLFLYLGTFFIIAAGLSNGILILMALLAKLEGSY
jgi:hypothetical protein